LAPTQSGTIAIDISVWRLDLAFAADKSLPLLLSPDERARADRFVHSRDKERYIAGRGRLRQLLGAYVGVPPEALGFVYDENGKPSLGEPGGPFFNLTHSHGLAALAVTGACPIGIDIEEVSWCDLELAKRFFSPREYEALLALPEADRALGFFQCWTRKEACVKVHGAGLMALDEFAVSLAPRTDASILWTSERFRSEESSWRLVSFEPAPDFAGAVAAQTSGAQLALNLVTSS
jgi:4'-phosphopantetheinyl transferase